MSHAKATTPTGTGRKRCPGGVICRNDGGPCELRATYCPICGAGPLPARKRVTYPSWVNHLPAWSCELCADAATIRWRRLIPSRAPGNAPDER